MLQIPDRVILLEALRTGNPARGNNGMGREGNSGSNRTNNGQELWDKFVKDIEGKEGE
jgi:hypothetical protein